MATANGQLRESAEVGAAADEQPHKSAKVGAAGALNAQAIEALTRAAKRAEEEAARKKTAAGQNEAKPVSREDSRAALQAAGSAFKAFYYRSAARPTGLPEGAAQKGTAGVNEAAGENKTAGESETKPPASREDSRTTLQAAGSALRALHNSAADRTGPSEEKA